MSGFKRSVFEWSAHYVRLWDYLAAQRVTRFIAISETVRQRIKSVYNRDSEVIYPPVDTSFFSVDPAAARDYFLVVSRFVPYKRIDLAVEAFAGRTDPLLIVGCGPQEKKLKSRATPNIEFLGQVEDDELRTLYQNCRALIFPGEEDFGLTPVEAQACGRPVVAFGRGGATETVREGVTGVFFRDASPDGLNEAVDKMLHLEIPDGACRENAERFDQSVFLEEIVKYLKPYMESTNPAAQGHKHQAQGPADDQDMGI